MAQFQGCFTRTVPQKICRTRTCTRTRTRTRTAVLCNYALHMKRLTLHMSPTFVLPGVLPGHQNSTPDDLQKQACQEC